MPAAFGTHYAYDSRSCARVASGQNPLIEFGRSAADRRAGAGLGKPETFKFLGSTLRKVALGPVRRPSKEPARSHAGEIQGDQEGATQAHASADTGTGTLAGAGRQGLLCLSHGSDELREYQRVPPLRGPEDRFPWERMPRLAADWLPELRNFHPWMRFAVKHSR